MTLDPLACQPWQGLSSVLTEISPLSTFSSFSDALECTQSNLLSVVNSQMAGILIRFDCVMTNTAPLQPNPEVWPSKGTNPANPLVCTLRL